LIGTSGAESRWFSEGRVKTQQPPKGTIPKGAKPVARIVQTDTEKAWSADGRQEAMALYDRK
jgi:hypothetical protein